MQIKRIVGLFAVGGTMAFAAACAPEPEPVVLSPTPTYNKMGDLVSCGAGYMVEDGACVTYVAPDM